MHRSGEPRHHTTLSASLIVYVTRAAPGPSVPVTPCMTASFKGLQGQNPPRGKNSALLRKVTSMPSTGVSKRSRTITRKSIGLVTVPALTWCDRRPDPASRAGRTGVFGGVPCSPEGALCGEGRPVNPGVPIPSRPRPPAGRRRTRYRRSGRSRLPGRRREARRCVW
jgi:hypothetical protein